LTALLVATAAFAALWILPGFGAVAAWRWSTGRSRLLARDSESLTVELARALVLSAAMLALIGGTLVAFRWFSGPALALCVLPLSVAGLPDFFRWASAAVRPLWRTAILLALGGPLLWSSTQGGLQPSHSFQWFYWDLGRQLSGAGGVPAWVLEYGQQVRWHPDYLFFSVGSEAYRWLSSGIGEADALVAWRGPVALLALAMVYAVLRLWVSRPAAVVATAAVSTTTFFLVKFNAYKPESLGVVLGLACVCLVAIGLRSRRPGLAVVAGVGFGVDFAIHGIAAAVCLVLAGSICIAEWWPPRRWARGLGWWPLIAAGAVAGVILLGTGLALQGRAIVASDAAHPQLGRGGDPTWVFLERDDANFASLHPPSLGSRVIDSIDSPWPGSIVSEGGWVALLIVAVVALAIGLRGPPLRRVGALSLSICGVVLMAAAAFFALAFDTFIPQHTGITRIASYGYLVWGMALAFLAEAVLAADRPARTNTRLAAAGGLVFLVAWAVPVGVQALSDHFEVNSPGKHALAKLQSLEGHRRDEAVLSNASTRGVVEFASGLEAPIEGRQPVIEEPHFLNAANRALADTQDYFLTLGERNADHAPFLRRLGIGWLLVVARPQTLGSPYGFGEPADAIPAAKREHGLSRVWHRPGVSLFQVAGRHPVVDNLGPGTTHEWRWIAAVLVAVSGTVAAAAFVTVWQRHRLEEEMEVIRSLRLSLAKETGAR
jgi:hypothetical protein